LDLRFDPFGMAQQQVALFGRGRTSARPVGLIRAHVLDTHAHGAQAGKHLERVDILAAVAAVPAAGIPVDRPDQPDLLVVAQRGLAEPAAPRDILDGESRHACSKPNIKRFKSSTAGFVDSLDWVAGGFGGVAASGWGGPAEGPVGQLVDLPARLL